MDDSLWSIVDSEALEITLQKVPRPGGGGLPLRRCNAPACMAGDGWDARWNAAFPGRP